MNRRFKTYPILAPLSFIYRAVMSIRNFSYDKGLCASHGFDIPVISVGNITVGGTGKTPHVIYLAGLLSDRYRGVAVLSRGYGRSTRGFILADAESESYSIGDEPVLVKAHFPEITVAVDEDRVHGIRRLSDIGIRTVVLDDAFQHRRVRPSLNILLIDWNRSILEDMVMPAGRMRESASGRKRADIIIFTKCPAGLDDAGMDKAAARIVTDKRQKVFFTSLEYGDLRPMISGKTIPENVRILAMTGIANPKPMIDYLGTLSDNVRLIQFPDHHSFSIADLEKTNAVADSLSPESIIVTTEKDEARLKGMQLPESLKRRLFILPVRTSFLREQEQFDRIILEHIGSFKQ